jgi:hypothetical protein
MMHQAQSELAVGPAVLCQLEAVLKSRIGWVDQVITPFARAKNRLSTERRRRAKVGVRARRAG